MMVITVVIAIIFMYVLATIKVMAEDMKDSCMDIPRTYPSVKTIGNSESSLTIGCKESEASSIDISLRTFHHMGEGDVK